jgi:hypothetical protein
MKRSPKFLPENLTLLDLTLEDLEVLLDDEQGLISVIIGTRRPTDVFGHCPDQNEASKEDNQLLSAHHTSGHHHKSAEDAGHKQNSFVVYTDDALCLYFVENKGHGLKFPQPDAHFHFLDTTDLHDWQGILRYLHWEQHGLNSLGDE